MTAEVPEPDAHSKRRALAASHADPEAGEELDAEASDKAPRTLFGHLWLGTLERARRALARWGLDLCAVGVMLAQIAWGRAYVVAELLQPEESALVQAGAPLMDVLLLAWLGCWCAVLYHGAGDVPESMEGAMHLSHEVAKALDVGRWGKAQPFSGRDGFCKECNHWKPPLADHCRQCGRCCLWMEHHCNFCMTCIGANNARAFVLFLVYGSLWVLVSLAFSVRGLLLLAPETKWTWGARLLLLFLQVRNLHFMRGQLSAVLFHARAGFTGKVMYLKFCELAVDVSGAVMELEQRISRIREGDDNSGFLELVEAWQELRVAQNKCVVNGLQPRGLLAGSDVRLALTTGIFGEGPGLRWALPVAPPRWVQPLAPAFNPDVCADWASLDAALAKKRAACQLMDAHAAQARAALEQWAAAACGEQ